MTRILDKLLGLAVHRVTASAGCAPDSWYISCTNYYSSDGTYSSTTRKYGHTTPSCGVRYTYDSSCIRC